MPGDLATARAYDYQIMSTTVKAFAGLLFLLAVMGGALFLAAGTFAYWEAWLFLAVFGISVLVITLYLMKNDPQLLERRTVAGPGAEKEKSQNIIQSLASVAFIAIFLVSALDHRFGWSTVPTWVVLLGDALVVLGLYIVFLVFKEQKVISTGPYALVRHPMYMGALIMLLGVPLALGSWWGLLALIPITLVIVWRLLDEERFLVQHLPGYPEYQSGVRYRLVPYVW